MTLTIDGSGALLADGTPVADPTRVAGVYCVQPLFDPLTERPADGWVYTSDPQGRVVATRPVVTKTPAERLADVRNARRDAYPPVGDQLDALYRAFAAMSTAGVALPAEVVAWLAACAAVKSDHPKPE